MIRFFVKVGFDRFPSQVSNS